MKPYRAIKRNGLWCMIGPDSMPVCHAFSLENLFYVFGMIMQERLATLRSI